MSLRLCCVCFLLVAMACAKSTDTGRDAEPVDAGDAGTDLDRRDAAAEGGVHDAGAHDAAPRPRGGLMANNPSECPRFWPSSGAFCTGTTSCKWSADCAFEGGVAGVTLSAQCVDGKWRTESPEFCRSGSRDPRNDDADGGT